MYFAIDIGGTKTLLGLVDSKGKLLRRRRFLTDKDQATFLSRLEESVKSLNAKKPKAVIVAIPGPVKNGQTPWLGNLPWINFTPLPTLKKLFPDTPIFLENDANLAGLSEAEGLPGISVYLTFSTGIGGGVIRNGKIDPRFITYEPGHEKYTWKGRPTEWEDIASAGAISKHYKKRVTKIHGAKNWQDIAHRMSLGIAPLITNIRPDNLIIGGPLSLVSRRYKTLLIKELLDTIPPDAPFPKITRAKRPKTAVVYGCALYAKEKLGRS